MANDYKVNVTYKLWSSDFASKSKSIWLIFIILGVIEMASDLMMHVGHCDLYFMGQ